MAKRAKKRKAKGVVVSAREAQTFDKRLRELKKSVSGLVKGQRKSADQLELELKKTLETFVPYFYSGGGGGIPDGK
jgi:hypothetical protein